MVPAAFSADPDRLHRFEQEARAAAALNHPNILAVHDIGNHDGCPYIVSELPEGETLGEHLQSVGSGFSRTSGDLTLRTALKADAMLLEVRGRLLGIPFEFHGPDRFAINSSFRS